ncbi:hypothetical protein DSM43518_02011 [Mycobacterium marinum]|uniref:hypothetical protein n=1 Tax=Mycobacterium marinum TaxID=1781 RepID=UPI000E3C0071|nr:hypothetical protein [Mycobacterium marinum]RFZ11171.1 hypothetical protein DSM43518_02011 [Mycobacterium marinum]
MLAAAGAATEASTVTGQIVIGVFSVINVAIAAIAAKRAGSANTQTTTMLGQVINGDPKRILINEITQIRKDVSGVRGGLDTLTGDVSELRKEVHTGMESARNERQRLGTRLRRLEGGG